MKNWAFVAIALAVTGAALQFAGAVSRNRRAPLATAKDPLARVVAPPPILIPSQDPPRVSVEGMTMSVVGPRLMPVSVWVQLAWTNGTTFSTNISLR